MPPFSVYVTEPEAIDLKIAASAFGDAPHTLVAGSADFSVGEPGACNTVLIRSGTRIDDSILASMPALKHVVRVGVGLDNVDTTFCQAHDIAVYNAPGANADAVAEYAVTVILLALRKLHLMTPQDQAAWNRFKFTGHSITGRTVGIVGFGHIGKLLFAKLRALGCQNFIVYDPFVADTPEGTRTASLDELLQQSEIISLHLPLIPETTHIINAEKLALMKDGTILLNAARGGIVDETAVLARLDNHALTYIADTVEGEPQVNPALLNHTGVILTPHIASLTTEAEEAMIRTAVENLVAGTTARILPA